MVTTTAASHSGTQRTCSGNFSGDVIHLQISLVSVVLRPFMLPILTYPTVTVNERCLVFLWALAGGDPFGDDFFADDFFGGGRRHHRGVSRSRTAGPFFGGFGAFPPFGAGFSAFEPSKYAGNCCF